ncbi:Zinc ribbon domain protein [Crateriforma conspicua]|uniref:Zinc ribbon domain protein n=1 Tax=Crateriforma conspicua TaxID=2527996 RepID=A0A5C6G1H3_9PLAN|nr:zinc ribbon domain-containing protein [Crateriforma conspicua]TWU67023.1 Zinc ribbon domain protein [Crateriforma conspicua]
MPLYEYECKTCEKTVEVLVRNESKEPECPGCGDHDLEKLISVPASPAVKSAGGSSLPMAGDCGAPGGCCGGGACGI